MDSLTQRIEALLETYPVNCKESYVDRRTHVAPVLHDLLRVVAVQAEALEKIAPKPPHIAVTDETDRTIANLPALNSSQQMWKN